tara:strand:- start:257 stop:517 length:261 start_codon:yes stop_codon:yes gene_type:complete
MIKTQKKYVTTNDYNGLDYRSIANIMTSDGHKMNHSSVRNYITRGFCKVVKGISKDYDLKYTDEQIKKIAQSPEFQSSIVEVMKGN